MTSKDLAGKLYRWAIQLQELDFEIVHRPGGSNVAADALSKATVRTVRASERDRTSERDQRGSSQSGAGDEGQILDDEIRGEKAHDKTAKKLREKSKCNDRAIVVADEIVCIRETDGSSRVLLPTALWVKVLKENHDSEYAFHLRIPQSYARVAASYWWSDVKTHVRRWAQSYRDYGPRKAKTRK
ncbi:hypothetical protein PI125_g8954 [Phytophthora idaei]|nr:hypothetical protein PI125_g8954 [Phytophthora idaei]KAG3173163.1 hypothetical protein PI126_g957 [Phytophthora idaei]